MFCLDFEEHSGIDRIWKDFIELLSEKVIEINFQDNLHEVAITTNWKVGMI